MTGAINALRSAAAELLREHGLQAVTAMESDGRKRWDAPVTAVSLHRVVCAAGGFRDYLGIREDPDTGIREELYGRAMELTLGLDIYAPSSCGARACHEAADVMAQALTCCGVAGLSVQEFEAGPVEFLERDSLYRLSARCLCKGWMVAAADSSGAFVDFDVKGRRI